MRMVKKQNRRNNRMVIKKRTKGGVMELEGNSYRRKKMQVRNCPWKPV